MILSPVVQNDKRLNEHINKAGCLFRSLIHLAEIHVRHSLGPEQIEKCYSWLVQHGDMKSNCWVLDHQAVIRAAQHYLGVKQTGDYVARDEGDNRDFGNIGNATMFIRHIRTVTGIGHFYICDKNENRLFDPYWPVPATDYVIGIRGYTL